jgi:cytoskeletal protein RodZ
MEDVKIPNSSGDNDDNEDIIMSKEVDANDNTKDETSNTDEISDEPIDEVTNIEEKTDKKPKFSLNKILWLEIVLAVLIVIFLIWFFFIKSDNSEVVTNNQDIQAISSFEECVTAGHPVLETYPEQCVVPNGGTFTRTLTAEEQASLDAANEPKEEPVEEEKTPDFGKITLLSIMNGDLQDYAADVTEETDVVVITMRVENTSKEKRGYELYTFSAENSDGEILEPLEVGNDNGLFSSFMLSSGGKKEVTLIFQSDTFLKNLFWDPSEDYEKDYQVFPVN